MLRLMPDRGGGPGWCVKMKCQTSIPFKSSMTLQMIIKLNSAHSCVQLVVLTRIHSSP